MNNLLSYCGLVDAKIRASDKDLPVTLTFNYRKFFKKISIGFKSLFQFCKWNLIAKLNYKKRCKDCQNFCKKVLMRKNSSNKKLPQSLKAFSSIIGQISILFETNFPKRVQISRNVNLEG